MSLLRRLTLVVLACVPGAWAEAHGLEAQALSVQLAPKSKARLIHTYGDRVAILEVDRPPAGLVEALVAQRGALFVAATRRSHIGDRLQIALELALGEVMPRAQLIPKSHRLEITFMESLAPPLPPAQAMIGRVPDLIPIAVAPPILPTRPLDHPCPVRGPAQALLEDGGKLGVEEKARLLGQVVEEPCRTFLIGEDAKAVVLAFGAIEPPVERWAYQAARIPRWARYPNAHAYTSLIAANVLTERGLYSEAEALLLADRVIKVQAYTPYVAYALARLYARNNRPAEADELLSKLLAGPLDKQLLAASWALRVETANRAGEHGKGLSLLRQARQKLGDDQLLANSWLRGAELALLSASVEEATSLFKRAIELGDQRAKAHAELRLGDLAVAAERPGWQRVAAAHYGRITDPDPCFEELLELRRLSGRKIARDKVVTGFSRIAERSTCTPARVEAMYGLARLEAIFGEELAAFDRLSTIRPATGWPAGMRPAMEALENDLATSLLLRRDRERRYPEVIELVAGPLQPLMARLPVAAQVVLAKSYLAVGLPERVEPILLPLLRRATEDRTSLSRVMLDGYLANKATDRARLVLDFLERQPDADPVALRLARARLELLDRHAEKALAILDQKPAAKSGDPAADRDFLRAEALLDLGRADAAAEVYAQALGSAPDRIGLGVRVISECARTCAPHRLAPLLAVVKESAPLQLEGERIRWLLAKRGLATSTASTASIWSRLRAVDAIAAGNEPR